MPLSTFPIIHAFFGLSTRFFTKRAEENIFCFFGLRAGSNARRVCLRFFRDRVFQPKQRAQRQAFKTFVQQVGDQLGQAAHVFGIGVEKKDTAVLGVPQGFFRVGRVHIPADGMLVACLVDGFHYPHVALFAFLGRKIAVGRTHELHGVVIAQHLVQLLLRPVQRVFDLFPVQGGQAGVGPGVIADFAAQIKGALPEVLILGFQGLSNDKERNGNVVLFA